LFFPFRTLEPTTESQGTCGPEALSRSYNWETGFPLPERPLLLRLASTGAANGVVRCRECESPAV